MSTEKKEKIENFGNNLRRLRKARKETLAVFSKRLGITGDNISKIETGKGNPSNLLIDKIEKVYGFSRFISTGEIVEVVNGNRNHNGHQYIITGDNPHIDMHSTSEDAASYSIDEPSTRERELLRAFRKLGRAAQYRVMAKAEEELELIEKEGE